MLFWVPSKTDAETRTQVQVFYLRVDSRKQMIGWGMENGEQKVHIEHIHKLVPTRDKQGLFQERPPRSEEECTAEVGWGREHLCTSGCPWWLRGLPGCGPPTFRIVLEHLAKYLLQLRKNRAEELHNIHWVRCWCLGVSSSVMLKPDRPQDPPPASAPGGQGKSRSSAVQQPVCRCWSWRVTQPLWVLDEDYGSCHGVLPRKVHNPY